MQLEAHGSFGDKITHVFIFLGAGVGMDGVIGVIVIFIDSLMLRLDGRNKSGLSKLFVTAALNKLNRVDRLGGFGGVFLNVGFIKIGLTGGVDVNFVASGLSSKF